MKMRDAKSGGRARNKQAPQVDSLAGELSFQSIRPNNNQVLSLRLFM